MALLFDVADPHLVVGVAVAAAFSIAVSVSPAFQKSRYLCALCLLGALAYHWQEFPGFLAVNGISYAALLRLSRQGKGAGRWRWACLTMVLLIVVFTVGRIWHWEHVMLLPGPVPIVFYSLDMWLVLRLVTLFWEVGSGTVELPSLSGFLIWTCLPLTLCGPVLRYSQMPNTLCVNRSIWRSSGWWREMAAGTVKMVGGLALPVVHGAVFRHFPSAQLWSKGSVILVTGPLSFYLTTAGYFTLMEVFGRPSGFKLPISFNYPIGRENIAAFWMNWNMTATYVFRDYLFYNRWGFRTYNVYFNTMVLFTLVGLWHATNAYWILWGFLHGLLFCGFMFWRKHNSRLGHIPLRGTPVLE